MTPAGREIVERTFLGSSVRLRVNLDDGHELLVDGPSHGAVLALGARVALKVVADRLAVAERGASALASSPEL